MAEQFKPGNEVHFYSPGQRHYKGSGRIESIGPGNALFFQNPLPPDITIQDCICPERFETHGDRAREILKEFHEMHPDWYYGGPAYVTHKQGTYRLTPFGSNARGRHHYEVRDEWMEGERIGWIFYVC